MLLGAPTFAEITEIKISKVQSFANGASFGAVGAYERVTGAAQGELDPADVRNQGIVNLNLAPLNARGKVEYAVDFDILRPADARRGNRKILYDVTNRGRKFILNWLMDGAAANANNPTSLADAGNALFLKQGYTIVWSGWDADAPRTNFGMGVQVPTATINGTPIVKLIREELVSGTRAPAVKEFKLAYEAANLSTDSARLTVRKNEADAPTQIAASSWEFIDNRTIRLLPVIEKSGTAPQLGALYELHYLAKNPKILGMGFAATRDLISFLRYAKKDNKGETNPVYATSSQAAAAPIKHSLAIGISQSGRYLRDHIAQGFNQDTQKRKVFDGVLAHISGVGRVFLNAEFAQAGRTNTQHEDHLFPENEFPFSSATLADVTLAKPSKEASLLRHDGFDPLLIETNTSTEYWQKGASLLHTSTQGEADVPLPANTRVYMLAGTQHGGRAGMVSDKGACVNPRNPHDPSPALRALLVALDAWVERGTPPPDSRVPNFKDNSFTLPDKLEFPRLPNVAVANKGNEVVPLLGAASALDTWVHPRAGLPYRSLVAKADVDGNEIAGIRLPEIAVPLATYTGWNLYAAPFTEGELCDRDGSYLPFALTASQRTSNGDSRLSVRERYASHADYVRKIKAAAENLQAQRLLLADDVAAYIARAEKQSKLWQD